MIVIVSEKRQDARRIAAALGPISIYNASYTYEDLDDEKKERIIDQYQRKNEHLEITVGKTKALILWSDGHIDKTLSAKEYSNLYEIWNLSSFPMLPEELKVKVDEGRLGSFQKIKNILNQEDVTEIINAYDDDIEGTLIFHELYRLSGCKNPWTKVKLNSLSSKDIRKAFKERRPGEEFLNEIEAGKTRRYLDYLYGINLTVASTVKFSSDKKMIGHLESGDSQVLPIGRVQIPVLAEVVRQDELVESHVPTNLYNAEFQVSNGEVTFTMKYDKGREKIDRKDTLTELAESIVGTEIEITQNEELIRKESPLLHNLSSLTFYLNGKYGYSAKQVMDLCQSLKSKGFISYPRTTSRFLPESMEEDFLQALKCIPKTTSIVQLLKESVPEKRNKLNRRIFNDELVDAHHAIITTTNPKRAEQYLALTKEEQNVYESVAKRMIQSISPDSEREKHTVLASADGVPLKNLITFIVNDGYRLLENANVITGERLSIIEEKTEEIEEVSITMDVLLEEIESESIPEREKLIFKNHGTSLEIEKDKKIIESLEKNPAFEIISYRIVPYTTAKPARHTDGTLMEYMKKAGGQKGENNPMKCKEKGLGTPATRATIIENLLQSGYVERVGRKTLKSTDKGRRIVELIKNEKLKSEILTREMEDSIELIKNGDLSSDSVRERIREEVKEEFTAIKDTVVQLKMLGYCPNCNQPVIESVNRYICKGKMDNKCSFSIAKKIKVKENDKQKDYWFKKETLKKILMNTEYTDTEKGIHFYLKENDKGDLYLSWHIARQPSNI